MALGDKVERLQETVAGLVEQVSTVRDRGNALYAAHSETARIVADLRREHEKEVALLKREIEELRGWKADQKRQGEKWSRRWWAFGPNLFAAVVGGLIAAAIAYFIPRR